MLTLIFTMTLYGMTATIQAGQFGTKEICVSAARMLSGPNWVGSCLEPISNSIACFNSGTITGYSTSHSEKVLRNETIGK